VDPSLTIPFFQYVKSHIPLPSISEDAFRSLHLTALIASLAAFWVIEAVIVLRRSRGTVKSACALGLSISWLFLAKVNFIEYILVCLPMALGITEVFSLIHIYGRTRRHQWTLVRATEKNMMAVGEA
jgi:hypothetical protein